MTDITFVTGNQHKADMMAKLMGRPLRHEKINLDELQTTDIPSLTLHKVEQAYEILQRPVLVDDFGFCIEALNDLPGPFTKFFVQPDDGLKKLCRIVGALESRSAKIVSVLAYKDSQVTKLFTGSLTGTVARQPRGTLGIATDYIFEPTGYGGRTRAELSSKEFDEVYATVRPITQLLTFLNEYEK